MSEFIDYTLTLSTTEAATGFFKALPSPRPGWTQSLSLLQERPLDEFLHRHALDLMAAIPFDEIMALAVRARKDNDRVLMALAAETILLAQGLGKALQVFSRTALAELAGHSPLIMLRAALAGNRHLHSQWIALFRDNIASHRPLPALEETGLPPLCSGDCSMEARPFADIKDVLAEFKSRAKQPPVFLPEKTAALAEERLKEAGLDFDGEMRHESSLSPFALLRKWRFSTRTDNGPNRFTLTGGQTSYGKGLTLDLARVSLMMEIVERCSAFASITGGSVQGYLREYALEHASYQDMIAMGLNVVNPAALSPEACYTGQPLHWVQGTFTENGIDKAVMIPVQCLFLFTNLNEINLFSGLGSTGLASGMTLAQAKVSALLEVIERHQEATVPFHPASCFHLVSRQEPLARLLASYQALGIHLQFQDITPASGIPCCKCFVRGADGTLHKGTSAHLDAKKAIISAMTETPYPFPKGPPSALALENLLHVDHETLPDYSTGDPETDLALLEHLLRKSGYCPCYVDLTRRDINLPVVKAIVPGMDIAGDFDSVSRVHPDLFFNYLTLNSND
ncbi:MAG: YcaO-like family protein [Pseudomonadota bacterium]